MSRLEARFPLSLRRFANLPQDNTYMFSLCLRYLVSLVIEGCTPVSFLEKYLISLRDTNEARRAYFDGACEITFSSRNAGNR